MPLTQAPLRRPVRVVEIHGGHQRLRRLAEMGLYPRVTLQVVSAGARGPVTVLVGGTRLALGHSLAREVWVTDVIGH